MLIPALLDNRNSRKLHEIVPLVPEKGTLCAGAQSTTKARRKATLSRGGSQNQGLCQFLPKSEIN
jgi:hypothetical protein